MGITSTFRVMVWGWGPILLLVVFASWTTASICPPGRQYLNTTLEACVNCTLCVNGDVVLRPCEIHQDTVCGPVSELFKNQPESRNPHRHRHNDDRRHGHKHRERLEIAWRFGDDVGKDPVPRGGAQEETVAPTVGHLELASTAAPFSSAETLVWDWQAITLTLAVFTCILFFLVITLYSFHQARQWRRLKENFDADVEELSARLSLMAAATSCSEKGELLSSVPPMSLEANYPNNRCVYLEQLLNGRKDTKITAGVGGNLYIEGAKNAKT